MEENLPSASSSTAAPADSPTGVAEPEGPKKYVTMTLRGRAVWMNEALRRKFDIVTDNSAAHRNVALETADGTLYPIVEDGRGRAFFKDERLRDVDLEMRVRRFEGSPMVQVIQLFRLRPEGKFEVDYWCDVCSIVMFEPKECECCQAPNRYRERRVIDGVTEPTDTAAPQPEPVAP